VVKISDRRWAGSLSRIVLFPVWQVRKLGIDTVMC
jgi:hypothetical protein